MLSQKAKRTVIVGLISLLCLCILFATYYIVLRQHTFKELIAFSTNPDRIAKKIKHLVVPSSDKQTQGLPREWNRSGEWHRYPNNPILTTGLAGSWDEGIATFASVIKDDDNFKMYYSGRSSNDAGQIGLATSRDGKNWVKYSGNPIVRLGQSGSWDDTMIWCPMVWKEKFYHMTYTGRNSAGKIQIGYATSTDGIHWTKNIANPVFNDPTWAHDHTEGWGVIKVEDIYLLWYNTLGVTNRQIGVAVSRNLINWTPYRNSPIFSSIHGTDMYHQFCAFPFRYGQFYYLIIPSQDSSINHAVFYLYRCKNPYFPKEHRELVKRILTPGHFGEWDDRDMDTPALLTLDITRTTFYQNQFWLYYSAEDGDKRWKEGLVIEDCQNF